MKNRSTRTLTTLVATTFLFSLAAHLRASENDDRIVSAAKNSYVFKTYLKEDSVQAASANGVVTLTGTVADGSHKMLAQHTAAGLPGVTSVDNQLKIKTDAPPTNSDKWLILNVKSALMFHRNVSALATEVLADAGAVTLRGEAASAAQKELTTEYATDVDGVKSVHNEMSIAVKPADPDRTLMEKIDDASITAQIKMSLLAHRSTSMLKTEITTLEGGVTVKGTAKNAAERSLVTKLVTDIRGVKRVDNEMVVQP